MTFSKEIIEIFDYIGEKFGIAIDWSSDNVIPYLKELCGKYINYEIATSVIWLIIGTILFILCIWMINKAVKLHKKDKYDYEGCIIFLLLSSICILITAIPMIVSQSLDIVKCIYFPELEIYEWFSSLIKTKS